VLAPNSASTLVQELVRQGYVERTVDPRDKRTAHLALSAMARRRLARWRDTRAAVLGNAIAALPAGERAAIAHAVPALGRLADQLEGTEP
jgi:DNA-binding MarR family transcriptional regulator